SAEPPYRTSHPWLPGLEKTHSRKTPGPKCWAGARLLPPPPFLIDHPCLAQQGACQPLRPDAHEIGISPNSLCLCHGDPPCPVGGFPLLVPDAWATFGPSGSRKRRRSSPSRAIFSLSVRRGMSSRSMTALILPPVSSRQRSMMARS